MSDPTKLTFALGGAGSQRLRTDLFAEPTTTEEHLTDEEFINYAMETLDQTEIARIDRHLSDCETCAQEMERLVTLADSWDQKWKAVPISSDNTVEERNRTFRARLAEFQLRFQEAIRQLLPRQAAFAAPPEGEAALWECTLPIEENGVLVQDLTGRLFARNAAFYLVVTAQGNAQQTYTNRLFRFSLPSPDADQSAQTITVELDEVTLVGIDLDLTPFLATEAIPLGTILPEGEGQ